jgi:exopolyphosphatase/guanosine-5'-triphosphate,3'-diphosphate pyrophosphatase
MKTPHKRVAVIDLGTNTFNLMIADVSSTGYTAVFSTKEGVALGMGGITKNFISEDAIERAVNTLSTFKTHCESYQVGEIVAFGTSAIRDAENKTQFTVEVLAKTGIEIRIISGEEEANYIYQGVCWSYDFKEAASIMDIGGGSTEFIHATENGIQALVSLNIGVSRVFQTFKLDDPYTDQDVSAVTDWFEEQAGDFLTPFESPILIGASGSFETFFEMLHETPFPSGEVLAQEMDMDELLHILDWTIRSTQAERDAHQFIIPIRRKMGPIAAIKTKWVLQKLKVKRIFVSPCSLKEGVLRELAISYTNS